MIGGVLVKARNILLVVVSVSLGFAMAQLRGQPEGSASAQSADRPKVVIDDTKAVAVYAKFCRVTGTPEEIILDYGLNSEPFGTPTKPIAINQKIVMNFYSSKRMLQALPLTIDRHETTFGTLETDVQKRVKTNSR